MTINSLYRSNASLCYQSCKVTTERRCRQVASRTGAHIEVSLIIVPQVFYLFDISLWRPLAEPIEDWPLAVCDGSTVDEADLTACDHVRKSFVGESSYMHYRPEHKWFYLSNHQPDEVLIVKIFDSEDDVRAKSINFQQQRSGKC